MGNWWLAASSWQRAHSCITSVSCSFLEKHQITQVSQPLYSPDLVPYTSCLFPQLKSPLNRKRFQNVDEIQENTMGQLMAIGRTVWDPKVPTLKGTEVSLSYVQRFLYLVPSSVSISIFHITWLETFWTDLIYANILNKLQMTVNVFKKKTGTGHYFRVTWEDSSGDEWQLRAKGSTESAPWRGWGGEQIALKKKKID